MIMMLGVGGVGLYVVLLLVLITCKMQLYFYTSSFTGKWQEEKIWSRGHRKKKDDG